MKNPFRRRPPDFVVGPPGNEYLRRWYLLPRNKRLNIYLHQICRSDDDRALHDHRGNNLSIILKGSYIEHLESGVAIRRDPGDVVYRKADMLHRLELDRGPVWTLFIVGPWWRNWGFQAPEGWLPHEEYLAKYGDPHTQQTRIRT